jgi:hypothetical protein
LLDALEPLDGSPAGEEELAGLLARGARALSRRSPSVGLGDDVRLAGDGVIGSGLAVGDELVQLSLYAGNGPQVRPTRVARPSRRR